MVSTGYVYETMFNVNCLGLDPNTLVANYYDKELATKLKKYGVEIIEAIAFQTFRIVAYIVL